MTVNAHPLPSNPPRQPVHVSCLLLLQQAREAEWTAQPSDLDKIVSVLAENIQADKFDFVFSLCDALLRHDLCVYPAFYRATFEVFMARSQPDDSDPDAEERLLTAKELLEREDENSKELWDELAPRVEKMLKLVNESIKNDLLDCPSPGHPDRRETKKLYPGMEGWAEEVEELEEPDDAESEEDSEQAPDPKEEAVSSQTESSLSASVKKATGTSSEAAQVEGLSSSVTGAASGTSATAYPSEGLNIDTNKKTKDPAQNPDSFSSSAGLPIRGGTGTAAGGEVSTNDTANTLTSTPEVQEPDVSKDQKDDEGSKQQKAKSRKKLPRSMRMRQANKDFILGVGGLGGTVESGKRVPKTSKRAVQDLFSDQGDGEEGQKAAGGSKAGPEEGLEGGQKADEKASSGGV